MLAERYYRNSYFDELVDKFHYKKDIQNVMFKECKTLKDVLDQYYNNADQMHHFSNMLRFNAKLIEMELFYIQILKSETNQITVMLDLAQTDDPIINELFDYYTNLKTDYSVQFIDVYIQRSQTINLKDGKYFNSNGRQYTQNRRSATTMINHCKKVLKID